MKGSRGIVRNIQLTEKGAALAEKSNKYFFVVDAAANKIEIKRAVEGLFNVQVADVNTMNCLGKAKRTRTAAAGKKADWKRAVVTLKEGHKIELT